MKVLGLFLGALVAFSLAGCGDDGGSSTGGGGTGGATGGTGGATGGTGGATGGTGGATGGAGGVALTCDDYCAEVEANCTGDNAQYPTTEACKGVCATFDPGTLADMSGATLGCHLYHGGAPAAGTPATHCPHAGPLGGGACGEDCANFCEIAVAVCGSQGTPPYSDAAACMTACMSFPDTTAVPYNTSVSSGDSLACRMYHLTVAATSAADAATHCPHIAATSTTCM